MTNQQTRKLSEAKALRLKANAGDLARREKDGEMMNKSADTFDLMKLASWGRIGQLR